MELDAAIRTASPHSHPTISSLSKDVSCFKEQVSSMLNIIRQQILAISDTVDAIEMRHRKKFLLFCGIPEAAGENLVKSVAGICQNQLKLTGISPMSIVVAYRLGQASDDRPRSVLVRFESQQLRKTVWTSKKSLKGSNVVITEFLTRQRQSLFIDARKYFSTRRVWTTDGNIYVKLPDGKKERLFTNEQLNALKSVHAPISTSKPSSANVNESSAVSTHSEAPAPVPTVPLVPAAAPSQVPAPAPAAAPSQASAAAPERSAPAAAMPRQEPVAGPSRRTDEPRRAKRAA